MVTVTSITLRKFLEVEGFSPSLGQVLGDFAQAAVDIADVMRTAPITEMIGSAQTINIQDEEVQKVDQFANDLIKETFRRTGVIHAYVSEEDEEATFWAPAAWDCYCDPADGSSNIDVAAPIGSILAVYEHKGDYNDLSALLRPGREMTAAAYVVYGSCTTLVLTIKGLGVQGFTLDPESLEWVQTHQNIRFPEKLEYESINSAYRPKWGAPFQKAWETTLPTDLSSRYIGGLVPDFHRNMLRGGVFAYPGDKKNPNGKLRLMYEEAPIAKIAEAAGGLATNGMENTLDLVPEALHERAEFVVGPEPLVRELTKAWTVLRIG